jgi:ribose transport system substrate-binding protein
MSMRRTTAGSVALGSFILVAMVIAAVLPVGGCSKKGPDQKLFVMVPKGVHPYYEPCYEGFQDAARKYGVRVEYRASKALEVPQQVEVIENLIARHVDGIAISALDDQGLIHVIDEATKAGIKVITFDSPAPSSKALTYIGTMNEAAGYAAAEELLKRVGDSGEVAVLQGGLGATNLNDRFRGFEKCLKEKAPSLKIVAREDNQGKIDIALNKTESLLGAHPNLKAIFSVSAEGVPGAAAVLKERKLGDKIVLAGFDDLPDTLAGIRSGVVKFCIAQRTYKMGWLAVEQLLRATEGKPLDRQIDTGVLIVNRENVDNYMEQMKKEFK